MKPLLTLIATIFVIVQGSIAYENATKNNGTTDPAERGLNRIANAIVFAAFMRLLK